MIAKKLKELREKNGITKAELSRELGITQAAYDRYEKETSEPSIKTIIYLSNKYNVTTDYLLKDETGEERSAKIEAILKEAQLRIINEKSTKSKIS